jgi:hypothetical protein
MRLDCMVDVGALPPYVTHEPRYQVCVDCLKRGWATVSNEQSLQGPARPE